MPGDSIRVQRRDDGYELTDEDGPIATVNRFLQALRLRGLSIMTMRAYAYDLVILYRWLRVYEKQLEQLVTADLLVFVASQREARAEAASINRRLTTTRLLYRFCTDRELPTGIEVSLPAGHYKGPGRDHCLGLHSLHRRAARQLRVKVSRKLIEPLSPELVRSFLRSLTRYRDLAIVHLMLLCGLRSCEVLSLELKDVVFAEARLRVLGKGRRERVLPLPELLTRVVRQYLDFERPRCCSGSRLFVVLQGKQRGEPMTAAGLRSLFRHRRRRRTLSPANPHRFRHTFGTDMARAGVRLPVLQRLMGHADMKTTLQYIELSLADIADEYRRAMTVLDKRYQGHGASK
jgi:site-specific recombinase XerD